MDMAKLTTYNKKRDFDNTDEPKGTSSSKKSSNARKLRFVVQRHHASRLHYDFRLELDGVLKSWAVPKGPSLYPKDKRLAMQVEDHPIDYASFEGSIPKGNYGAGTVHIFDSGYYEFLEARDEGDFLKNWHKGSLKFKLFGHILRGEFALVQMKGDEGKAWLLIKHQDRYATDSPYNSEDQIADSVKEAGIAFKEQPPPKPMLTKLVDKLPAGDDWVYEKKYDGFRIIAVRSPNGVYLYSRSEKNMNHLFPSIVQELAALDKEVCLDGELVIEDKQGHPYFQLIASGEPIPSALQLRYYVFDLLSLEKEVLTEYTLAQRKELLLLLFKRLKGRKLIQPVEELKGDTDTLRQKAEQQNWEGIIAKEKESRYLEGVRSGQWVKYKLRYSQEAIICGYTEPQGSRSHFGALVLGMYKDNVLTYIGNCGTGFDDASLENIYKRMKDITTDKKPFAKGVKVAKEKEVTWLKPELIGEIYYSEWTADRHLRHPVFKMLRTDKKPQEIESEELLHMENKDESITIGSKTVQLTNLDKVYWPQDNYIKGQMIAYYEEMADYILPYLKDKPISLHRFPNGIDADSFFQKDVDPDKIPDWINTVPIHAESTGKEIDYIVCNDKATLLYIANLGSIEINPWLATYKKPENPDFAVLDLDPNGADFEEVIRVALLAKEYLDKMGASSFIKTSGSTGLHIYLNVAKKYDYDIVRDFIQLLAEMLHERCADTTSIVRDPKKRKGMIYLDFLQNRRGQTIAAPYSLRPKEGATVSAPLTWDEVRPGLDIKTFNIKSMLKRVKEVKDPWADIWTKPVDIKKSLKRLS